MATAPVTHIYIAILVTYSLATVFLVLRLVSRRINRNGYWLDDYFAIASWVFATAWNTLLLIWISYGFGQHIDQLPDSKTTVLYYSNLLNWNLDLFYAFSLGCSKISLLSLYWRLFSITNIRHPIRWLAVCALVWIIVRTFLTIFMCVPVQGFWDKTINSTCNINKQQFFFASTLTHLVIDVAILCLPIWQVSQLQLKTLPKIGLYITFAFGTFVCIASIIVLAPAFHYNQQSEDVTWDNISMFIWATVEVNLAIAAGSFPMLRGIVVRLFKGHSVGPQLGQSNGSSGMPRWPSQHNYRMAINCSDDESAANLAAIPKKPEGRVARLDTS